MDDDGPWGMQKPGNGDKTKASFNSLASTKRRPGAKQATIGQKATPG